jgi:probable addiction module antidote protein
MQTKENKREFRTFNSYLVEELKDQKYAQIFLDGALEEYTNSGDLEKFLSALRIIADAKGGVGILAKKTKTSRQSIYKALSKNGNPTLHTLDDILKNLGFKLSIKAI